MYKKGSCPCPTNTIDRDYLHTPWCAGGQIAVPEIKLCTIVLVFN